MLWSDNYFSHDQGELAGQQFALTSLISICCKIKMEKVAKQKWRKLQLEIP
jgi:hypothetical protein